MAAVRRGGVAGGLSPPAIYALGEAIFAYIDELSAESAEGYAEEQTAAAGESGGGRRRLVRLLAQDPPAAQEAIRTPAAAAGWTLPRGGVAALVAATQDGRRRPGEALLDSTAARLARRLGEGRDRRRGGGAAVVFVPDPDAPGRRRLQAAVGDGPVALGPTVPWAAPRPAPGARSRRTGSPPPAACRTAAASCAGSGRASRAAPLSSPTTTSPTCCSPRTPPSPPTSPPRASLRWTARGGARARLRRRSRGVARPARAGPGRGRRARRASADGPLPVRQLRDLFGDRLEDPDARFELALALRIR